MDFKAIETIIDELVAFITKFAANLRRFIGGFKGGLVFDEEAAQM